MVRGRQWVFSNVHEHSQSLVLHAYSRIRPAVALEQLSSVPVLRHVLCISKISFSAIVQYIRPVTWLKPQSLKKGLTVEGIIMASSLLLAAGVNKQHPIMQSAGRFTREILTFCSSEKITVWPKVDITSEVVGR